MTHFSCYTFKQKIADCICLTLCNSNSKDGRLCNRVFLSFLILNLFLPFLNAGLVFVVEKLGSVLQLTMSLSSASMGPLTGVFLMGIFLPFIDSTVSHVGSKTSFQCEINYAGDSRTKSYLRLHEYY